MENQTNMAESTLVHVGVAASNLERSLRFWRDALGLPVKDERPGLVVLSDGTHNFTVFEYRGARPSNPSGQQGYLHIGVKVDSISEAVRRFTDRGFEIICDDVDNCQPFDPANPPTASFKVEDPDGIVVDVTASDSQWIM
jgi:catechol 2,3-dioxygenase-like lactoylglutathione lyase family enzyme